MYMIPSLLFGISSSLDALLMGFSLGLRRITIRLWQNLLISLITLLGTCFSVGLGSQLALFLPGQAASIAGSIVLILLGGYYLFKWLLQLIRSYRKKFGSGEITQSSHTERSPVLHAAEVFVLSLSLSVNNIGMGLAASVAGLPLFSAAIATALCSILFLSAGNRLGRSHVLLFIEELSDPLSGVLLIGLGILQLL